MKQADELKPDEQTLQEQLLTCAPALQDAMTLVQEFVELVYDRRAENLDAWIMLAMTRGARVELCRFARGLMCDLDAVRAALIRVQKAAVGFEPTMGYPNGFAIRSLSPLGHAAEACALHVS